MSRPPVIGLAGRARVGKDTAASFLLAAIGGYRYSFADPMRGMLLQLGIDMNDPYWIERKEDIIPALGRSPRYLMQTLGTEWGRNLVHPQLWLLLAQQRLLQNGPGMIVTDVRFENEADWVRSQGGRVVHILRDDAAKVEAHTSEAGVAVADDDLIIHNNGTLEEFQDRLRNLF